MKGYIDNIEEKTLENENYREVLYTGPKLQLVVMALEPGDEIGEEIHDDHDQFIRFEEGEGEVILDGEPRRVGDGDAVVIPAGTKHNVVNVSSDAKLKLYTLYAPPEHEPGTIHPRKRDSIEDEGH
jgi:mannose-6-phosphate isomerase-like protein (cupin superfamily)